MSWDSNFVVGWFFAKVRQADDLISTATFTSMPAHLAPNDIPPAPAKSSTPTSRLDEATPFYSGQVPPLVCFFCQQFTIPEFNLSDLTYLYQLGAVDDFVEPVLLVAISNDRPNNHYLFNQPQETSAGGRVGYRKMISLGDTQFCQMLTD